jgi:hypothetical protein
MIDGYVVQPARIRATGDAFAGQQGTPTELAGALEGARAVDTGEPGLTSQVQTMVTDLASALKGLATGLGQDAAGLREQAQDYAARDAADRGQLTPDRFGLPPL